MSRTLGVKPGFQKLQQARLSPLPWYINYRIKVKNGTKEDLFNVATELRETLWKRRQKKLAKERGWRKPERTRSL